MKLNRRIFLAVLGATAAASAIKWKRSVSSATAPSPGGICFFGEPRGLPAGRPRAAAIIYLLSDVEPQV